jgi:peptidoglycan/LPS O-acetylase OafA/YrhL
MRVLGGDFRRRHSARAEGPDAAGTLVGVQLLRGLAAVMVVVFHAGLMVRDRIPEIGERLVAMAGAAGVDLFFPISGFVMLISARRLAARRDGWRVFAERRLIRIVPLYWLATTAKIALVLAVPAAARHTDLSWWHSAASYLFVFARNGHGLLEPVIPVGWTLNYEMFFYAVFAAVLFCRRPLVPTLSAVMPVAVLAGALGLRRIEPLAVLHPIVLEFVAGMWIAALTQAGFRARPLAAVALALAALAALAATSALPPAEIERARLLLWGLPGAALLFAAVSLEPAIARLRWRLGRLAGDASYSIYLSHGFVLAFCGVATAKAGLHGAPAAAAVFAVSIAASVAVGICVYAWVERPIIELLLRWRRRGDAPLAAAPTAPAA